MSAKSYLERIGYSGSTEPTEQTLTALHRAHMMAVPFENLDIGLKRKIVCEETSFVHKIVELRRGGFCYELNGAFAALLRELGFKVTLLSARVPRDDGSESPEFDHLALRVDLQEAWLADVGFGDSFLEPLRLQIGLEQPQDGRKFRIVDANGSLHMEMLEPGRNWRKQYSFTLTPRTMSEFAEMCQYHQTSPESPFTRRSVCSKATPQGRVTIADRRLVFTRDGQKMESILESNEDRTAALKQHFGINL